MTALINLVRRTSLLTVVLVMLGISMSSLLIFAVHADAAQITTRSLRVSSSANGNITVGAAGSGTNGAQTRHTFTFTEGTSAASIGSLELLYCTTPLPGTTCTAPTGMDASTATSVATGTSAEWTMGTSTANRLRLTRTGGASAITNTQVLAFGNGNTGTDYIKNPTTDNEEFFVRISTFSDTGFTTAVDQGTVANSTAQQIDITAKVQETLNFSVGAPDNDTEGGVPAPTTTCAPFTDDGDLLLGQLPDGVLDFAVAYDAHSYFRLSTNANGGAGVYYAGDTLKFGTEDVAAIGTTPAASAPGTEQFGLGIDSADATANGYSMSQLAAQPPYNNGDGTITAGGDATFAYTAASLTTPELVAQSTATVTCDTASIRYLGNISTTTPPGVYTTTISYIAAPIY